MTSLGEINRINKNISNSTINAIRALHLLIFKCEGNRQKRARLRKFEGFSFLLDSEEYKAKLKFIHENLTDGDLTLICNILNIDHDGNADELSKRICTSLMNLENLKILNEAVNEQEDEDTDEQDVKEEENKEDEERSNSELCYHPKFLLRDIEDSIRPFTGSDNYTANRWIKEFEDMRKLLKWNDLETFIYAKKSIKGFAKTVINCEPNINSWVNLKRVLRAEFPTTINSATLHQMLVNRKMKKEETLKEYFCHMRELAGRGSIEDDALIKYTIDGINDDIRNKVVLFGCSTVAEFKKRIDIYEEIKLSSKVHQEKCQSLAFKKFPESVQERRVKNAGTTSVANVVRCYNCGKMGHVSSACTAPKREPNSCFKCGSQGHQKKDCPRIGPTSRQLTEGTTHKEIGWIAESSSLAPTYEVKIKLEVNDVEINATLDSGSPISLISEHILPVNVIISPYTRKFQFEGVNKSKLNILGELKQNVSVNSIKIPITFYVVPENTINSICLLGRDFLSYDGIQVKFQGNNVYIDVKSTLVEEPIGECISDILNIDISNNVKLNEPDLDINNELSLEIQSKVKNIIKENYNDVEKPKEPVTNLELALTVKPDCHLGYLVDGEGICPSTANVAAVANYPIPKNFRELHSFLGLISYFRKFIHNFAIVAQPLYKLLKSKINFVWSEEESNCFERLKNFLISESLIAIYSPTALTELHCDASAQGYGSILVQKQFDNKCYPMRTANAYEVIKWQACYSFFSQYHKPVKLVFDGGSGFNPNGFTKFHKSSPMNMKPWLPNS
ncbi:protein Dek isoform X1 [Rhodnius prolixus]|uniref:protein Dek isoform X1 n=1 Tax=Rhodnius prolixus TaxID=13249 RepID=UPI003D18872F